MPLSEGEREYYHEKTKRLAKLKAATKIGIFGSFFGPRKDELLTLKEYLCEGGYNNTRISEDLDSQDDVEKEDTDPVRDRRLSEALIMDSDIHIFVLPARKKGEPDNLLQSVSMEIQHLCTLDQCGQKSAKYVIVCVEHGLRETMGGVCKGLLLEKEEDWKIYEYKEIEEIFKFSRQACINCILEMYNY